MAKKKKGGGNPQHQNQINAENNNGHEPQVGEAVTGSGGGAEKKASIKVHMHCDGCVREIHDCLLYAKGVESLQLVREKNTVNVVGNKELDPKKLIQKLEKKLSKKPLLLPPSDPKKDQKENAAAGENQKKNEHPNPNKKKPEEQTMVVLKIDPPCKGCFKRAWKLIKKTKGEARMMEVSQEEDSITVKGTKKALELLKDKLPKTIKVSIPQPKKDGGGGSGGGAGGGGKKPPGMEIPGLAPGWCPGRFEYAYPPGLVSGQGLPPGLGSGPYFGPGMNAGTVAGYPDAVGNGYPPGYPYGHPVYPPAPQLFSDENPNACSIM